MELRRIGVSGCSGIVSAMPSYAITVVGHDRPGIVHAVTDAVATAAGNLEDSSMTLLRGHFAMTLLVELADTATAGAVARSLAPLAEQGLAISVLPLPPEAPRSPGVAAVLSVHGADRPGIVHAATGALLRFDGNITDLSTRLAHGLYVLTADVVLPAGTELAAVAAELDRRMAPLQVRATLRPAEEDVL